MHSLGKGRRSVNQSQSPEQPQHFLIMVVVRNSKYRLENRNLAKVRILEYDSGKTLLCMVKSMSCPLVTCMHGTFGGDFNLAVW